MLHIHNGDSTAGTAREANLPGEHLAFREAMICGPVPAELPPEKFREVRARHLSESYNIDFAQCLRDLGDQQKALEQARDHDEVILWFEHDLFCQIHLVYLLNWFSEHKLGCPRLSLVSIDAFPGVEDFRGLGQLNETQLASLFPARQEITSGQLNLGSKAWRAFTSSNPTQIESLLQSDTSALPFLHRAMTKHLERFPSIRNGLGRIENVALDLIAAGQTKFMTLFPEFGRREAIYGLGDTQFYLTMKRLADAPIPLLITEGDQPDSTASQNLSRKSFQITKQGQQVMNGERNFVSLNGIDMWLGGVHLDGKQTIWDWDESQNKLVQSVE